MIFIDENKGWFVGNDNNENGVIFKTNDGGENWQLVLDNLIGSLYDIEIKDNHAWVSGNYGLLLKSNDSLLTWIDNNNKPLQNEFSLNQNYPNPFNPTTTIEYSIPLNDKRETSNVHLIIYDILGREVKTLVNEIQKPGNYNIQFDGSKLSSGVYYYQLKYGSFVQTKKMLLLK
jgi:hypothetical protein